MCILCLSRLKGVNTRMWLLSLCVHVGMCQYVVGLLYGDVATVGIGYAIMPMYGVGVAQFRNMICRSYFK